MGSKIAQNKRILKGRSQITFKTLIEFGSTFTRILLSLVLGAIFFFVHYQLTNKAMIQDSTWLLPVIFVVMFVSLEIGMHFIRKLLFEMEVRLNPKEINKFKLKIKKINHRKKMLLSGLFFAILYSILGWLIDVPYENSVAITSFHVFFTIIGFFSGEAIYINLGIVKIIKEFIKHRESAFDYTDPDGCAGVEFLGNSLIMFSSISLLNGVITSIFIVNFNFTSDIPFLAMSIKYFWLLLPYVVAIAIVIAPAIPIHVALNSYKLFIETSLTGKVEQKRHSMNKKNLSAVGSSKLQGEYSFIQTQREQIHVLKTWPFNIKNNMKYITFITTNSVATYFTTGQNFFKKYLPEIFK
ncbi:MAG: hypothetical protein ABUK01_04720 [Leptospirales bacterium]